MKFSAISGKIVVDDVRDVLHVNAARGDVRGNQDAVAPLLKSGEGRVALRLRAVAMNHGGGESFASQVARKLLGAALGAREHQASAGLLGEQALQQLLFALAGNFKRLYAHVLGRLEQWTRTRAAPGFVM